MIDLTIWIIGLMVVADGSATIGHNQSHLQSEWPDSAKLVYQPDQRPNLHAGRYQIAATAARSRRGGGGSQPRKEHELSQQISSILDRLLFASGYDNQIRPEITGPPLQVDLIYAPSMH